MSNPLIFTDLDGTLLDHNNYSFTPALPALKIIKERSIPLIINSSKTANEIKTLRHQLKNQHPFIVENGAAVFIPDHYFSGLTEFPHCLMLGTARNKILQVLNELKTQHHFLFENFASLSNDRIVEMTGLTHHQAAMANDRIGSEPLSWLGDKASRIKFAGLLLQRGLKLLKGGRFWHVQGQVDKALAMRFLIQQYQKTSDTGFFTIALGDSENDRSMLESADVAVVVKSENNEHLKLNDTPNPVIYTQAKGPEGWREAMLDLLETHHIGARK